MINIQKVKNILRSLRIQKNITQKELANRMDVDPSWISKVESNVADDKPLALDAIERFCRFYDIDLLHIIILTNDNIINSTDEISIDLQQIREKLIIKYKMMGI